MQIPDIYSLEHLSDEEFWDIAFTKAFSTSSTQIPFAHLSLDTHTMPTQQETEAHVSPETALVFDGRYSFPLHALYEIISMPQHITFLPDTPAWMMGLTAWRGRILATIDLHTYMHTTMSSQDIHQHINQDVHVHQDEYFNLLIAHHADTILAFATTVSTISTFEQIDTFIHPNSSSSTSTTTSIQPSSVPLDIPTMFEDIVQRLERTAAHE